MKELGVPPRVVLARIPVQIFVLVLVWRLTRPPGDTGGGRPDW